MNENEFATGSVPVMVAARIYGLIFGRKQYTRVRTRNNYNSLYERRVIL